MLLLEYFDVSEMPSLSTHTRTCVRFKAENGQLWFELYKIKVYFLGAENSQNKIIAWADYITEQRGIAVRVLVTKFLPSDHVNKRLCIPPCRCLHAVWGIYDKGEGCRGRLHPMWLLVLSPPEDPAVPPFFCSLHCTRREVILILSLISNFFTALSYFIYF